MPRVLCLYELLLQPMCRSCPLVTGCLIAKFGKDGVLYGLFITFLLSAHPARHHGLAF